MDTTLTLPESLQGDVEEAIARAVGDRWASRIWARDTSLWTDDQAVAATIAHRLGWLDAPTAFVDEVAELTAFGEAMAARASPTSSSAAWAAPRWRPRCSRWSIPSRTRASGCTSSIRPTLPRWRPSTARSTRRARCASSPPSPAARPRRWPSWPTTGLRAIARRPLPAQQGRQRLRLHLRSRRAAGGHPARQLLPRDVPEPGRRRRPLQRADLRGPGAGGAAAARPRSPARGRAHHGRAHAGRQRRQPGAGAGRGHGRARASGPRQAHLRHRAGPGAAGRLAGAAHRRVHRQGRRGHRARRWRAAGRARGLRRRSRLRPPGPCQRHRLAQGGGRQAGGPDGGRPPAHRHPPRRRLLGGGRVLPLGVRHRGGRHRPGRQPLRRAQRHRVQAQHQGRARHLRQGGAAAGTGADRHPRGAARLEAGRRRDGLRGPAARAHRARARPGLLPDRRLHRTE